jgi:hypothetical protein
MSLSSPHIPNARSNKIPMNDHNLSPQISYASACLLKNLHLIDVGQVLAVRFEAKRVGGRVVQRNWDVLQ